MRALEAKKWVPKHWHLKFPWGISESHTRHCRDVFCQTLLSASQIRDCQVGKICHHLFHKKLPAKSPAMVQISVNIIISIHQIMSFSLAEKSTSKAAACMLSSLVDMQLFLFSLANLQTTIKDIVDKFSMEKAPSCT